MGKYFLIFCFASNLNMYKEISIFFLLLGLLIFLVQFVHAIQ